MSSPIERNSTSPNQTIINFTVKEIEKLYRNCEAFKNKSFNTCKRMKFETTIPDFLYMILTFFKNSGT